MIARENRPAARLLGGVALGALVLGLGAPANAQAASEEEESRRLETVVVTSTKRDTTLQDAPISIGVVSGETIEEFKISDLTDLQSFVPSLVVQKTFGNWAVRVRGLGSGVTNIAFDSSVSIFNDGIYCGRSRCLEAGFFDVQNVEVARGPQGALFGKSTIAGALTVTSARPTDEPEAYASFGAELENGGYRFASAISGPIADTLRARFAMQWRDLDGDMKNGFTGEDDASVEAVSARGSLEWDITPNTMLWAKIETASSDTLGRRNQLVNPGALLSPNAPINRATLETNLDDVRFVSTGVGKEDYDFSDQTAINASLTTSIGDHELVVTGGAWNLEYKNFLDVDGVPEALLNTTLFEEYEQQSLEARLLSPEGGTFEYIVGAMYHNSLTETGQHSSFFPAFYRTAGVPAAATASIPGAVGAIRSFKRDSDTVSVYGQLTWNATDALSFILDGRYTKEQQDGRGQTVQAIYPGLIEPEVVRAAPFQAGSPTYLFFQTREDESFDPSIRAIYSVTDDINVYAAFSTGSKPGGLKANDGALGAILLSKTPAFQQEFAGRGPLTAADLIGITLKQGNTVFDFEDESAESYEVGVKAVLAGGAINLNAALFTMDFENLQTSSYDGTRFIIGNAASAEVSGLEIDGQWLATDNLRLTGSAAFIDSKYNSYTAAQCPIGADDRQEDPTCIDGQGDLSGRRLERSPEIEVNLGAAWDGNITPNYALSAAVDMYYSGDYFARQDFDPDGRQDAFTKWNARLSVSPNDGPWEIALIGRNLTDERTIQHAYEVLSEFVSVSEGRSIFLEGTWRW